LGFVFAPRFGTGFLMGIVKVSALCIHWRRIDYDEVSLDLNNFRSLVHSIPVQLEVQSGFRMNVNVSDNVFWVVA
jgi:hypothetical protein